MLLDTLNAAVHILHDANFFTAKNIKAANNIRNENV